MAARGPLSLRAPALTDRPAPRNLENSCETWWFVLGPPGLENCRRHPKGHGTRWCPAMWGVGRLSRAWGYLLGASESPFRVHIKGERPTAPPTVQVKDRGPRPVGSPRLAEPRPGSPSAAFREPRGNMEVEAQREQRPEVSRAQARTGTKYIQR